MTRVLFARIGWMRWYKGPQADDEKPIGGGKYNKDSLGHEAFNFREINGQMLGYFQPKIPPIAARKRTNQPSPSNVSKRALKVMQLMTF